MGESLTADDVARHRPAFYFRAGITDMKTDAVPAIGMLLVAVVALGAGPAGAQLVDATLFKNITAGAGAFDDNGPGDNESYANGPSNDPIPFGAQVIAINLVATDGGAQSSVHGQISYQVLSSELTAKGFVRHYSKATGELASALAGFDAVMSFRFDASEQSEYRIFGWVKSDRDLSEPELIACQRNGIVLAGDTRATLYPLGLQQFEDVRTIFPNEPVTIECGAVASGGAAPGPGGGTKEVEGLLEWRFEVRFSAAGPGCADPSGDGQTTATDSLSALHASIGLSDCDLAVCDVNDSGSVSATDALGILTMAVGLPFAWNCPIDA